MALYPHGWVLPSLPFGTVQTNGNSELLRDIDPRVLVGSGMTTVNQYRPKVSFHPMNKRPFAASKALANSNDSVDIGISKLIAA